MPYKRKKDGTANRFGVLSSIFRKNIGTVKYFSQNCIWENEVLRREVRRGGC